MFEGCNIIAQTNPSQAVARRFSTLQNDDGEETAKTSERSRDQLAKFLWNNTAPVAQVDRAAVS